MPVKSLEVMLDALTTQVEGCKAIKKYSGRFNLDDIKRVAENPPAILLSCLGLVSKGPHSGCRVGKLRMAAFILATAGRDENKKRIDKDIIALSLVDQVVRILDEKWPLEEPQLIEADNLFAASGKTNAALWAITWEQKIALQETTPLVEFYDVEPLTLYLGQAPKIGAAHKDDYVQIIGSEDNKGA
ncbi:MAG: hypothetical protein BA863_09000 [Desulfovibrio sp. S3730MH75]|nr:MAG: hypothetical protein BA863_09000 [Desulfovibrio sp. S3730MH75]